MLPDWAYFLLETTSAMHNFGNQFFIGINGFGYICGHFSRKHPVTQLTTAFNDGNQPLPMSAGVSSPPAVMGVYGL
jgi:hypothetical protein